MQEKSKKPVVMIDGYNLGLERGTGVATYARNLTFECDQMGYDVDVLYGTEHGLSRRDPTLREVQFFSGSTVGTGPLARWSRDWNRVRPHLGSVAPMEVPVTGNVITSDMQNRLPKFDRLWNAQDIFERSYFNFAIYDRFIEVGGLPHVDIMHWTYPLPLKLRGARNIYTLHDLVPLRLPYTTLDHKERYLRLMKRVITQGDHIVTVSETSRDDIINMLGCPPDKITNTYQSVDIPAHYRNKSDDAVKGEVEGIFGLPYKNYFLFFGAIEPKKNVGRIIEAYLTSRLKEGLAIVGPTAWKADRELRLYNEYRSQQSEFEVKRDAADKFIARIEYLPFPLLVSAIRGAKATVFPSLYEGFGLPILESMLLGTPVITSKEGATAEIAGDAALLVDPYDTQSIGQAMEALSSNAELREMLRNKGLERAETFSPARYRERLSALYNRL